MNEHRLATAVVSDRTVSRINRREALRRLGLLGAGTAAASSLLAACGGGIRSGAGGAGDHEPYRILAFAGGGIRGIVSAGLLKRLSREFPDIVTKADLLAGTSVGANIVSGLVANLTPDDLYESLSIEAPKLFAHGSTNPRRPAYDVNVLVEAQERLHPTNQRLRDIEQKVLLTSFNVGSEGTDWRPILFNNLSKSLNADTPLVEAVVSSSAMPGELGSLNGNVDGAFVDHDPTLAAIALAVNEGVKLENIVAICFGTGLMANWVASDTSAWGAQQWQNGDGNPGNNTPPTLINGTTSPVLSMCLSGTSTNLTPELVRMMLPGRYAYLNPTLDRFIPENDTDPDDLDYMAQQAERLDLASAVSLLRAHWA